MKNKKVKVKDFENTSHVITDNNFGLYKGDSLYREFIHTYDAGKNLKFPNINFRVKAEMTSQFGLARNYVFTNGKWEVSGLRLHNGDDHGKGGSGDNNIYAPFDFDKSQLIEFKRNGEYYGYGTLVRLINTRFGFEIRIAHVDPREMSPKVLKTLKSGKGITKDTIIGPIGSLGNSTAPHSHTEILSLGETSDILNQILKNKYKNIHVEYSKNDVVRFYRKIVGDRQIDEDILLGSWETAKAKKRAMLCNKYRFTFTNKWGSKFTRYSPHYLFNF